MFFTQNYTTVWCDKCNVRSILEPGKAFEKLECKCKEEEVHGVEPRTANKAQRKSKVNQE